MSRWVLTYRVDDHLWVYFTDAYNVTEAIEDWRRSTDASVDSVISVEKLLF